MPAEDLAAAVAALAAAGIIGFPTDTVYGIGARIDDAANIARIYAIKHRSADKPLAILCADYAQLASCFREGSQQRLIDALARTFLPGALTIVGERAPLVDPQVTGGLASVGVRIPDHAWCRNLLAQTGPLAVTSANRSGAPAYTGVGPFPLPDIAVFPRDAPSAPHTALSGIPSTVVEFRDGQLHLIRAGAVTESELAAWYARFEGQG